MSYDKDLKKVMILYPGLRVLSSNDYRHLINIHNVMETIFGEGLDTGLVRKAYENKDSITKLASKNDYFYLAFSTVLNHSGIKKVAYPDMLNQPVKEGYDLEKWSKIVYDIYNDVESKRMDYNSAVELHSSNLDQQTEEDVNFKKWLRYYNKGENKKYSKNESSINKKATFAMSPGGVGRYTTHAHGVQSLSQDSQIGEAVGRLSDLLNGAVDSNTPKINNNEVKDQPVKSKDFEKWVEGLHRTIRSLDNRLRKGHISKHLKNKKTVELLNLLNQFSSEIVDLETEKTAVDLAFKYSNIFKKLGFDEGAEKIIKHAQDAEAPPVEAPANSEPATPAPAPAATPAEATSETPAPAQPETTKAETPLERALSPITEAKEGEYESLAGDVGLSDAVAKLEDIAGRLSDRRTIRLLAEFDIILDKIGIAPMFPELAEAQSKLIDAYSYALTRVTKMLGMLSSGKSIIEISESKKNELVGKTMKEVNRGIEQGEAAAQAMESEKSAQPPEEKGPAVTQEGLSEAGLVQPPAEAKS